MCLCAKKISFDLMSKCLEWTKSYLKLNSSQDTTQLSIINYQWKCNDFSRPLLSIINENVLISVDHYYHESTSTQIKTNKNHKNHVSFCKILMSTEIVVHITITFHEVCNVRKVKYKGFKITRGICMNLRKHFQMF